MKNQPWWIVLACLASIAITSSASALGRADYERLYMVESDVPGLEKKADNKDEGPVPERTTDTFRALGGTFAGRVQWYHPNQDELVWTVMDMRYVFPSERAAEDFIDREAANLAEGMAPIARSPTVGDDSQMFGGNATYEIEGQQIDLRHFIIFFRVKNVVGKVYVGQGPAISGNRLQPLTVASIAGRALRRIEAVVGAAGQAGPPVPVPPSQADTVTLPTLGLTLRVSASERWETQRVDREDGAADLLTRTQPADPPLELLVSRVDHARDCEELGQKTMAQGDPSNVWIQPVLPPGYYPRAIEHEGGRYSSLCAETNRGLLWVMTNPSTGHPNAGQLRPMLAAIVDAAGPKTVTAPPPSPSPTPSPSPSPAPSSYDDDDWDLDLDDFAYPHLSSLRLQINGSYLMPETEPSGDRRRRAFGLEAELDGGFVTHRLIGFAMDMGLGLGYHFDENVPFDARLGVGFGVGIGPLSLSPVIGLGVDTRGAGDAVTHQMDGAFYWYPGGRLRLRFGSFAMEGQAMHSFRGAIDGEIATDITNLTRVTGRLIYVEHDGEIYGGFRWTRYHGADDENGNFIYPSADQFGGVIGFGFSFEELFD